MKTFKIFILIFLILFSIAILPIHSIATETVQSNDVYQYSDTVNTYFRLGNDNHDITKTENIYNEELKCYETILSADANDSNYIQNYLMPLNSIEGVDKITCGFTFKPIYDLKNYNNFNLKIRCANFSTQDLFDYDIRKLNLEINKYYNFLLIIDIKEQNIKILITDENQNIIKETNNNILIDGSQLRIFLQIHSKVNNIKIALTNYFYYTNEYTNEEYNIISDNYIKLKNYYDNYICIKSTYENDSLISCEEMKISTGITKLNSNEKVILMDTKENLKPLAKMII